MAIKKTVSRQLICDACGYGALLPPHLMSAQELRRVSRKALGWTRRRIEGHSFDLCQKCSVGGWKRINKIVMKRDKR